MAEVCFNVPDEAILKAEKFKLDLSKLLIEAISAKAFEKQLAESTALQRAVFEFLVSKSKLTERDANELSDRIKEGMWKRYNEEL